MDRPDYSSLPGILETFDGLHQANQENTGSKCTHPDRTEEESCEERAVGCSEDCTCCMGARRVKVEDKEGKFIGLHCTDMGDTVIVVRLDGHGMLLSLFHPSKVEFIT